MVRKFSYLIFILVVFLTAGCVKETYNMDKLSKNANLSPTLAVSAIKAKVKLSDIAKASDTVVYDDNNFVKIVFKKDSVINLKLASFYDFSNMISFSQSYTIGELSLDPFQGSVVFTLDQISQRFSAALRNQFVALNDGANHPFPAFPSTTLLERTFTSFSNFQNAVFSSGFLDISITNNLTAPLNTISVNLFNTSGHTAIGNVTIPAIQPGQTQTVPLDLTGKSLTNSIIAAAVLSGSPGNSTPVIISLANSNIQITLKGRNLKIKSGRVLLTAQTVTTLDNKDTISFNPGTGVELEKLKITTGNISYHVQSSSTVNATLNLTMPTALRNGIAVSEAISIAPSSQFDGTILFNNTVADLNADIQQPYNRIPVNYTLTVNSNNTFINFNSTDKIQLDLKLLNPNIDYLKGYFGQIVEPINSDSIDLGIKDILNDLTGDFLVSSPSITLNYSNSFSVPVEITLTGKGSRGTEIVNLGLAPFILSYPVALATRDISSSFTIDKNNSSLPQLISIPPDAILYSGTVKMNPAGDPSHLRNNYVFGNSRIFGALEVEVPMEFSLNNLQFTKTVDNFLKSDNKDDNSIKPEDFKLLRVDIIAKNGFPLGASLKMSLLDTVTNKIKSTVTATGILLPAPVDNNGKVTGVTETKTSIEFTQEFFSSIDKADQIVFSFTLNTTGNGSKEIKIYSDYTIDFKAALVVKPDIKIN
jgi:hypothetical protein